MQCNTTMKCEMRTQKQKYLQTRRYQKKTAKLSSQVSPENILNTSVSRHVQFSEVIKIEKKKKYKNKKGDIYRMRPKAFSSIQKDSYSNNKQGINLEIKFTIRTRRFKIKLIVGIQLIVDKINSTT